MASVLMEETVVTLGCLVPTGSQDHAAEVVETWAKGAVHAAVPADTYWRFRNPPIDRDNEEVKKITQEPYSEENPVQLHAIEIRLSGPSNVEPDPSPLLAALNKGAEGRLRILYVTIGRSHTVQTGGV